MAGPTPCTAHAILTFRHIRDKDEIKKLKNDFKKLGDICRSRENHEVAENFPKIG